MLGKHVAGDSLAPNRAGWRSGGDQPRALENPFYNGRSCPMTARCSQVKSFGWMRTPQLSGFTVPNGQPGTSKPVTQHHVPVTPG